jgi:hypothetical protein
MKIEMIKLGLPRPPLGGACLFVDPGTTESLHRDITIGKEASQHSTGVSNGSFAGRMYACRGVKTPHATR